MPQDAHLVLEKGEGLTHDLHLQTTAQTCGDITLTMGFIETKYTCNKTTVTTEYEIHVLAV